MQLSEPPIREVVLVDIADIPNRLAADVAGDDALEIGDRVLVNKLSYDFHDVNRGDLIVFNRPPSQPEGEDDLIRLGMVRDVTQSFVSEYLAALLDTIRAANVTPEGQQLPSKPILEVRGS